MTRILTILLVAIGALVFLTPPATADWNEGDVYKMHFPQMPDVGNGMNVLASTYPFAGGPPIQKVLADDWMCTESGPITGIHIWGSWLSNDYPWPGPDDPNPTAGADPGNVTFRLSIHKDIPKELSPTEYSLPEFPALWEKDFKPGEFRVRNWEDALEPFFDPNQNEIIGEDYTVWQYNFSIPEADAQWQDRGNIYWLNVTALPGPWDPALPDEPALFGWKTSYTHEFDDAVYWDSDTGGAGGLPWPGELIDPRTGESLDLAFVITPEPGTVAMLIGAGLIGLVAFARRRRKS